MTSDLIKQKIAALKAEVVNDLLARKKVLENELADINVDLAELNALSDATTPAAPAAKRRGRPPGVKRGRKPGKKKAGAPDASTLADALKKADGQTLNRKGLATVGFRLKEAIVIAKANPGTFSFMQNKAQGSVTLK